MLASRESLRGLPAWSKRSRAPGDCPTGISVPKISLTTTQCLKTGWTEIILRRPVAFPSFFYQDTSEDDKVTDVATWTLGRTQPMMIPDGPGRNKSICLAEPIRRVLEPPLPC